MLSGWWKTWRAVKRSDDADLGAGGEVVEALNVPPVGITGAVERVPLDLHDHPLPAEEEVRTAQSPARSPQLDLRVRMQTPVVHPQPGDGLGGRPASRVSQHQPLPAPSLPGTRALQLDGESALVRQGWDAPAADRPPRERGIHRDQRLVAGPGP